MMCKKNGKKINWTELKTTDNKKWVIERRPEEPRKEKTLKVAAQKRGEVQILKWKLYLILCPQSCSLKTPVNMSYVPNS